MAYFAKLNGNNIVTTVEAVVNGVITDGDGVEQEQLGINFLTQLYGVGWYKRIFPTPVGSSTIEQEIT